MATPLPSVSILLLTIFLLSHYSEALGGGGGGGGLLGGRTKLKNLKTDKEIQDLGRYAVQRYNNNKGIYIRNTSSSAAATTAGELMFREVVEAEMQVVSGVKYYLKITAVTKYGSTETFDAVLLVTPWKHSTKQLIKFTPSKSNSPAIK